MKGGGSLLLALPLILGLKRANPSKSFWILTTPMVKPFAELLDVFDRIIIIDDRSSIALIKTAFKALLQCIYSDTVIDLEVYSRLTTLFSLLTLSRNRLGYYLESAFWRKNIHTHLIFYNQFSPSYFFYDQFAYLLGTEPADQEACQKYVLNKIINEKVEKCNDKRVICISASCSSHGRERMLTPDQWLLTFRQHIGDDIDNTLVFFLGGKLDNSFAEKIICLVKNHFPQLQMFNQCGLTSLAHSIAILRTANEFWGVDSALLHFARLMRIVSISFWGPTSPDTRLRKIEGLEEKVIYNRIPCSPCIHVTETPPCHGNNLCIQLLFNTSLTETEDLTSIIYFR